MDVTVIKEIKMPLRYLNRQQTWLLPPTLDELIPDDHPARFIAMFVDNLDEDEWRKLSIGLEGDPLGAPAYHPRVLLGVWLYGFMLKARTPCGLCSRDESP
jgi:transposase